MRTCLHCAASLEGRRSRARWCSVRCRTYWTRAQAAAEARKDRLCVECRHRIPDARRLNAKTCSEACHRKRNSRRNGKCRHCRSWFRQAATGHRLYCNYRCRMAAFLARHPYVKRPRVYKPRPVLPPIPRSYTGDAMFDEARKVLRFDSPGDFEDDILGEAVLAIVEGRDPQAAVRRFLANEKANKARRVQGIDDIGYADGRLIIVWQHREEVAA